MVDDASAIKNPEQGGPAWTMERVRRLARRVDWADLRAFLDVAEGGGIRTAAAAAAQPVSANTLRRRVVRLEEALGSPLLRRSRGGSVPTEAGGILLRVAREMRDATVGAASADGADVLVRPGEVRIGCTEGLGSLWLTPRLDALRERVEGRTVALQLDYDPAVDRSDAVDVGVSFGPPDRPGLVRARLATLHYALFASPDYLRRHGTPVSLDDHDGHRFIEQAGPGLSPGLMNVLIGTARADDLIALRSNSSLSVYWACVAGAGIAALPTYARAISSRVVPLDVPLPLRFELWYYYHADARHAPSVRAAIEWLKEAFDPVDHPWFSDRFVHPRDFPGRRGGRVVNLFEDALARSGG